MNQDEFLLPFESPLISFERWLEVFSDVKTLRLGRRFGYGIEVSTSDLPLAEFQDILNLKKTLDLCEKFYFLITHKNRSFPVHIDGVPGNKNAASINWPIINCDSKTTTVWYDVINPEYDIVDGSYFCKESSDKSILYKTSIETSSGTAFLFRSDINHQVCSLQEKKRIMVKWMTKNNSWQEANEKYRRQSFLR